MIAMGCTEPAAAALSGAKACALLGLPVERLAVRASRDMVKNAMGVGLPNCSMRGIQAAVALGAAGGDVTKGLGILSEISEEQQSRAIRLATEGKVSLALADDVPPVYISVTAYGGEHSCEAVISGEHSRFAYLRRDDDVLLSLVLASKDERPQHDDITNDMIANLSLAEIVDAEYGLRVGKTMGMDIPEPPSTIGDAYALGAALAAAASDARMAGCPLPVVINSGSGNQGITVSVPVLIMARFLDTDEDHLIRALCISHLVALVLTAKKDRLSALCGAFTAAIGTACALAYLQGGNVEAMDRAVNNMVGNLTGIICDGAKGTCALKIYSSVEAAAISCRLALAGVSPRDESGIVGKDALQSFSYLTQISHEGMEQTDRTILAIMMGKQEQCNL